ncbi:conjugal transfer protein [Virgibacillus salexigens]|uniref:Conjugal transfer protein n=1 Tax=Virgibacillus kapii TaxID=1638645 RepID=A0ABQ2DXW6_9BACI|nr:conjugal transfer protein [Virgibacillus kapii]GGJ77649.1 hypothetical protein GCM10007111_44030 [Virgibacillus kapii]
MNLFNKLRKYFQDNKIQKVKKEDRKLPKSKGNGKGARFTVWFILILIILLSPLAFLRAQTALDKSKNAESAVQAIGKEDQKQEVDVYDSPMLNVFANEFVDKYLTIPKEDEDRAKHKEQLQNYFAEGITPPNVSDFTGYRKLDSKTLYDVTYQDNKAVMSYLVEYTNVSIEKVEEEKEVKDGDKKKKVKEMVEKETPKKQTAMLNIPVRASENGGYAVVESPYYTNVPDIVNADMAKVENPLAEKEKLKTNQTQEISTWLETFLADYAANPAEDMTYVMDEPKGLNGLQEFVSVQDVTAYPTEKENRYIVKATAIFKEKEVPITHQENLSLIIEQQDNKFFVKQMDNTLGGE